MITFFEDIKIHYQNSPCLNHRTSNFRRAITPIVTVTEMQWTQWTTCSGETDKSTRTRNITTQYIRNHFITNNISMIRNKKFYFQGNLSYNLRNHENFCAFRFLIFIFKVLINLLKLWRNNARNGLSRL